MKLGDFVAKRLIELACPHVFAIPGDPVCNVLTCFTTNGLKLVEGLNELNTAYAVEGYSRVNGFGCLVVTDGAGELSALNGVAACFAEQLPILFIVGTFMDAIKEDKANYRYRSYCQTINGVEESLFVDSLENICEKIDNLLIRSLHSRKPVSMHVPHHLQDADIVVSFNMEPLIRPAGLRGQFLFCDRQRSSVLQQIATHMTARVSQSKRPLFLVGNQVVTYDVSEQVRKWVESVPKARLMHIPRFSGILGTTHPQFVETQAVDSTHDLIIQLGFEILDDVSGAGKILGRNPDIRLSASGVIIDGLCSTSQVHFPLIIEEILKSIPSSSPKVQDTGCVFHVENKTAPLTVQQLGLWSSNSTTSSIWDLGRNVNDLLGFAKKREACVITQQVFSTIGWALPATIGVMFGNESVGKHRHALQCWIGDGAFLMTFQEVSTLHAYAKGCECAIELYLLDNSGYEGSFNELPPVDYQKFAEYSRCPYQKITSIATLEQARSTLAIGVNFFHIILGKHDCLDEEAVTQHAKMKASLVGDSEN